MTVGWDDPRTAAAYEAFGERHSRYRQANEVLVAHARLGPASAVLDVGAGIGGTAEVVLETLGPEGLEAERFEFRLRLTQVAYRDWLKIPPISDRRLAGLSPEDRGKRIDREFRRVDPASWRWERWLGFAAWRCG